MMIAAADSVFLQCSLESGYLVRYNDQTWYTVADHPTGG